MQRIGELLTYCVVSILSMANALRHHPAAPYLFSATPLGSRKLSTYDG